jgi:hypothetical protein
MTVSKNLFDYAPSELSQDAFLCWICSQYNTDDLAVRHASQNLLHAFLKKDDSDFIEVLNITRQYKNIDVLLQLRYQKLTYMVIVEDKTDSVEHNDQLKRYRNSIENDFEQSNINRIFVVYYKTGILSEYTLIRDNCDVLLDRHSILQLLSDSLQKASTVNPILLDYVENIKRRSTAYDLYRSLPLIEWQSQQFQGFFEYLQHSFKNSSYWTGLGYNDNRNGGHWTFWFGNDKEVGSEPWKFLVNVETPSANRLKKENWLLRAVVRLCGNGKTKHSRREFDLPEINTQKYYHHLGKDTIMGELMRITKTTEAADWDFREVETAIKDCAKEYDEWCEKNLHTTRPYGHRVA